MQCLFLCFRRNHNTTQHTQPPSFPPFLPLPVMNNKSTRRAARPRESDGGGFGFRISVDNSGRADVDKNHTIVLIQLNQNVSSRTYYDFETLSLAMEGILKLFEQKLKQDKPMVRNITYDIKDLYNYIDGVADMSCLVLDSASAVYVPHSKDWIKQSLLSHLKQLAQQQQQQF